jgi:glycopeptide antibiotics resistance protein
MTIVEYTDEIVDPGKYSLMSLINLIGNGLLFVPFGFFLPLLCRHLRKWRRVLALTSVIVLVIEVTQYFTLLGVADIDDFILNVAGSMLGYILYAGIREDILSEHAR